MTQKTARRTVPQIFIGATHVGGCDDLIALDQAGKLLPLLSGEGS
jgi:glutaredoxin 3